jgi:hypothetical protein
VDDDSPVNRLSLEVVYDDEHLIQVECRVAVDDWSGVARAYTTQDDLRTFADVARRFGETSHGAAAWEAGADNSVGMVGLRLYTIDRSGHIRCHVRLASSAPTEHRPEEIWRFAAELPTEAGQVIAFARQLAHVAEELRGQAVLEGRPA